MNYFRVFMAILISITLQVSTMALVHENLKYNIINLFLIGVSISLLFWMLIYLRQFLFDENYKKLKTALEKDLEKIRRRANEPN